MAKLRSDGSRQSANAPDSRFLLKNKTQRDFGIYRCMITKVHYVGDSENFTFQNQQVTYSAIIQGGDKEGQEIENIKSTDRFGGQYNYSERIWRPINYKSSGLSNKSFSENEGDIVYVSYIQGDTTNPIIIAGGVQLLDLDSTGATRSIGPILKEEYNGVLKHVNKDGEFSLIRKGGVFQSAEGYFLPQDKAPGTTKDVFEAKMLWTENSMWWGDPQTYLEFLKTEKKSTLSVGNGEIVQTWDAGNNLLTIVFKSGLTITANGAEDKAHISLASGDVLEIDGATNKITLSSGFIDLGQLVTDFSLLAFQLISAHNNHTHQVIIPGGSSAGTYASLVPPPLPITVASTTVQVQP